MKEFVVPRNVGDKIEINGLSVDQIVILTIGLVFGLWFEMFSISLPLAIGASVIYGRYSKRYPDGYMFHAAYWFGILNPSKRVVESFKRNFYQ